MNESPSTFRAQLNPAGKIHENFFPTPEVAGIPPLSRDADRKPRKRWKQWHPKPWNDKKRFCWERLKEETGKKHILWKG